MRPVAMPLSIAPLPVCQCILTVLWYLKMEMFYGIKPNQRHYTTVVDMLARSGCLSEAEKFIKNMPYKPEANVWAAVLNGCRTFGDWSLAERSAEKLSGLAERKPGGYVLLSNIYAS